MDNLENKLQMSKKRDSKITYIKGIRIKTQTKTKTQSNYFKLHTNIGLVRFTFML